VITHLLLLQARADLTEYEERELGEAVYGLTSVPGVQNFSWGPDFSGRGKGYTHAAVMYFDSRDALQTYMDNDRHKEIVRTLNRLAPERLVIDYETGP
jgi:hypothetical protein